WARSKPPKKARSTRLSTFRHRRTTSCCPTPPPEGPADVPGAQPSRLAAFGTRLVVALVIAAGLTTFGVVAVNRTIDHEVDRIPRIAVNTAPAPEGGANYLLVGSDSRQFVETDEEANSFGDPDEEAGKRSDTIMVIHVEPEAGRSMILSFPRDLRVN